MPHRAEALCICRRRSQYQTRWASIYWWLRAAVNVICVWPEHPESHVARLDGGHGGGPLNVCMALGVRVRLELRHNTRDDIRRRDASAVLTAAGRRVESR